MRNTQHFNAIYLLDVFSSKPYAGNPLAVVMGEEFPSIERMQKIAAEINFSETAFVLKTRDFNDRYRMRIFTPSKELEFAGHPILGTAWVIRHYLLSDGIDHIRLNTPVGTVSVEFETDIEKKTLGWFDAPEIMLGDEAPVDKVAQSLGLSVEDINTTLPIKQMSAGTSIMMVPVKTLSALNRAVFDLSIYDELSRKGFTPLLYLFTEQTHYSDSDYCARFFFDAHGIREDPATGGAAAFFGKYLLKYKNANGGKLAIRVEQGYEIRRPSMVYIKADKRSGKENIRVGGYIVPTMSGELL